MGDREGLEQGWPPLAVEHVDLNFRQPEARGETLVHHERRGGIYLEEPVELSPNGPSKSTTTPLGPLLTLGFSPREDPIVGLVTTTGGREWWHGKKPLIEGVPPGTTSDQLDEGLDRLFDEAEKDPPPVVEGLVWLKRETPYLERPPEP